MVVTQKQVFWSKVSEKHEDIIEEFGLKERDFRKNITLVRIEIVPPVNGYTLPPSKWVYNLEQDILPEWYVAEEVEKRARKHLKKWRKHKIIMPKQTRDIKKGEFILFNYGTVGYNYGTVDDNYGTVKKNNDSGMVNYNSGTVNNNSGTVSYNYGTVKKNSGTVGYNYGTVDYNHGTVKMNDNYGTVNDNYGTVKVCKGKSTIITYVKLNKGILQSANAVLVGRSGKKPKCYIGKQR
jgi:hypothetical protein